jgi:diaminohydroxyphosphoribosylaminopyrimidine deaminase/5-amino-6-(5-phosphoribosylamino)uracil reductase
MNQPVTAFDEAMMQHCLDLARQGLGKTAPNPVVGAVIVNQGKIIGEGFHPGPGQPHAEVFALREAGENARGATVYVSLEPCSHYGRTPPCADALIKAKVAKVVVGMVDPNPLVAGQGLEKLKNAGIEVVVGVEEEACRRLNEAFIHRMIYQKPFGILKYAMTLDGKIATTSGHSAWVTSRESRHHVHQLRASCDAVVVGGKTVRQDNPYLTTHQVADHNPLRVVMSQSLDLPTDAHLWNIDQAPTLVITEEGRKRPFQEVLRNKGVDVIELNPLTPTEVMKTLYNRDLSAILWECGGTLAAQAIAEGAVQKIMAFIAPKIIGGKLAPSPVGDLGLLNMNEAIPLTRVELYKFERDFLIEGYLS